MKLLLTSVVLCGVFHVNPSDAGAYSAVGLSYLQSECGKVLLNKEKSNEEAGSTLEGQWPWQVAVYQTVPKKRYICGGTLVSKRHVITAAHCVTTRQGQLDKSSPVVYLGKHNVEDSGYTLKEIRIHPEYNATIFNRDLAILELQDPVTFSDWVQPTCLWPDSDIELKNIVGQSGTVVGWSYADAVKEPKLLLAPVISQEMCIKSFSFFEQAVSDSTFCAGLWNGCIDSGHGMVFEKDGSWYLRGVVSVTVANQINFRCDPEHYTIIADVAQALPWIKENIKET